MKVVLTKEFILMNIETFKGLCMITGTSKSKEIRQYYLKLEEVMHETLNEETEELKMQLQIKNDELHENQQKLKAN
jgi:phage anti-repressor protein